MRGPRIRGKRVTAGAGVVLVAVGTLALGVAQKSPCIADQWMNHVHFARLCYSDIYPLFDVEQLRGDRLPYIDICHNATGVCDEYPPVTMYAARALAYPADSNKGFFIANIVVLSLAAIATTVILYRIVGERALYFAAAPTLVVSAFINWDMLAVIAAVAATWAFLKERHVLAGILLGVGIAAKLYPALLLPAFVLHRLIARRFLDAAEMVVITAMTWMLINVPFIVLGREGWLTFWELNSERVPDWDSLWMIACEDVLKPNGTTCPTVGAVNIASLAALVVLGGALTFWLWRKAPRFEAWTLAFPFVILFLLVNKVYSPQYSVWLLPWFALALPRILPFVAFAIADVAVFYTRFSWMGTEQGLAGVDRGTYHLALIVRAVVLLLCLALYVRTTLRGGEGQGIRLNQSAEKKPPRTNRTSDPPANVAVTSRGDFA